MIGQGLITSDQLEKALFEQRNIGHSLGRVLIDLGMLTEAQVVQALATQIDGSSTWPTSSTGPP